MFIRKRSYHGAKWVDCGRNQVWETYVRIYEQICEAYRDEQGRPRQRVLCSLQRKTLATQIAEAKFMDDTGRVAVLERVATFLATRSITEVR